MGPRDGRPQQPQAPVQHGVAPTTAGNLQLANFDQHQQPGAADNTHDPSAAAARPAEDEPGCCLSPRGRHARGSAAGRPASGAPAGAGQGAATVVVVRDGASSEGGSSSNAGHADCRSELKQKWDCLSCLHCIIMEVATTAAFFVSFWYWVGVVVIGGSSFTVNGGTMMAHAGNVVVALLQVLLTRLPIVSYHFQALLWYATVYCIFLWIFGAATGIWRYGLNFQLPRAAGVFIIIPVITFAMFLLWYFAAVIREGVLIPAERKIADKHRRRKEQSHQQHAQQQQQHAQQHVQQHNNSVQHAVVPPGNVV
ncbi:hypothetical protein COO60DRAFT_1497111 [Scenedesmus sp. NREL 46B-D3]|nr:hypothetical protein COO60DRAFT_1497111 [Scenedesmus sp. NREL 46B-D3]